MLTFCLDFFIFKMHENFVDYGKEILNANESQRNKIQFLQRERIKRDHYLSDLQENLSLNKQTLRQYNQFGANSAAVASLNQQAQLLIARLKDYYEEYQSINASLLMEQQMRLSDRQIYEERLVEFENKMVDLRKYLHDKEESFSSVVARLRRYEGLAQPTIEQKLHTFKKEIGERHVHEFIAELIKEKNTYQRQCENMQKHYYAFNQIKNVLLSRDKEAQEMISTFEKEYQLKISNLFNPKINGNKEEHGRWRTINPNHDLIKLLKKQKLNNLLLQDALNDAIDKNQELFLANDLFRKNIDQLQRKCHLLRAENTVFALRLAEYDHHYCRDAAHRKKYYEQGENPGLRYMTEQRLKQYGKSVEKYFENEDLRKCFTEKMKEEVQRWSRHIRQAQDIKKQYQHAGLLIKSSSTPRLLINFQLEDGEQCNMIIDEF